LIDRRAFLGGALAFLASPAWARSGRRLALAPGLESALEESPYVYVCPLLGDGRESTCHGEVWYAWLDGAAVVITASDRWKARALARGLDRARLWVGDHGRWKQIVGRNDDFRAAPSFDARASAVRDDALLDRVLAAFEVKYPAEIGRWRDRMRQGYRDGSRVLIRYEPVSASG